MAFNLRPFAVLRGNYILRFQDDERVAEGETVLPVVADHDPALGPGETLRGPEYEVLRDRVRAYGIVIKMTPEELAQRDAASIREDAFIRNFVSMTPAQVAAYVQNNTGNLAQVQALLTKMAVMLLATAKREYL